MKKFLTVLTVLVLVLGLMAGISSAAIPDDWPMFHHDLNLSGYSTGDAPDTANVLWTYQTDGAVPGIMSSPAIVGDKVYIGANDNSVYCLDKSTGTKIWSYQTDGPVFSAPAVAGGKVYVGSTAGTLYCVDAATGAFNWSYASGGSIWGGPAVQNGKVFANSYGGAFALDANTGAWIWTSALGGNSHVTVADGMVFIGTHTASPTLAALDENTGAVIWTYNHPGGGFVNCNGAAVAYGKVYFGVAMSPIGEVICLDENTGASLWVFQCRNVTGAGPDPKGPGWVTSTPAVHEGKVFVGSDDQYVYCLNAYNGIKLWEYQTGACIWSAPAVADGKVYVGANDHILYCLKEIDGSLVWNYYTGSSSRIDGSPAVSDGMAFVGDEGGKLFAFRDEIVCPPVECQWLPPISNPDYFYLGTNSTVPIKWTLRNSQTGAFVHQEDAFLEVTGPIEEPNDPANDQTYIFRFGEGSENMRIDDLEEYYIVNFSGKDKVLGKYSATIKKCGQTVQPAAGYNNPLFFDVIAVVGQGGLGRGRGK